MLESDYVDRFEGMTMRQLIEVKLNDGTACRMAPKALNLFLTQHKVVKFKRSDGWAVVGRDPLRDMNKKNIHYGFERRTAARKHLLNKAAIIDNYPT